MTTDSPKKQAERARPRWRRRLRVAALALLVGLVVFRVALVVLVPAVLTRVAHRYDLNCTYDRLELSILGGDAGIYGLRLVPREGGPALLQTEYCRAHISPLHLLLGRLVAYRVEADGVEALIERQADGHMPLLDRFLSASSAAPAQVPGDGGGGDVFGFSPKSIDLSSPLRVDALRVSHVRAIVRDEAVSPPIEARVDADLRVSDLAWTNRPTTFELDIGAEPLLDTLHVEGEGTARGKLLDATCAVTVRGIHPRPAGGYLQRLGVVPTAHDLTLTMNARLHTDVAYSSISAAGKAGEPDAVQGSIKLSNVKAAVDGEPAASLDQLSVDISMLSATELRLSKLLVDGGELNVSRTARSGIAMLGLEYLPPANAAGRGGAPINPTPTTEATDGAVAAAPQVRRAGVFLPIRWSVPELELHNLRVSMIDQAVAPVNSVSLILNELALKNIVADRNRPDAPVDISGNLQATGLVRTINVSGRLIPFAARKTLTLNVDASGIRPDALRPYLQPLGIESELQDGRFSCALDAAATLDTDDRLVADVAARDIQFADAGPLLEFADARARGVAVDLLGESIGVDDLEINGPKLAARRSADGAIELLGFRLNPSRPAVTAARGAGQQVATPLPTTMPEATAAPAVAAVAPFAELPRLRIGHFAWKGVALRLDDATVSPATSVTVTDVGVELTDLLIDTSAAGSREASEDATTVPAKPGTLHAWLNAPEVIGSYVADGSLSPERGSPGFDGAVAGLGIHLDILKPYLARFRVEPVLHDGSFAAQVHVHATRGSDGLALGLDIDHAALQDAGDELAGIDALHVEDARVDGRSLRVGKVELAKPRITVTRAPDRDLVACGIEIVRPFSPVEGSGAPAAGRLPSTTPWTWVKSNVLTWWGGTRPMSFTSQVERLEIHDGSVRWLDQAAAQPVDLAMSADVAIDHLALGEVSAPASDVTARLTVGGVVDSLKAQGTFTALRSNLAAHLDISGDGVQAGQLAAYLPAKVRLAVGHGQIRTMLDASATPNPLGGVSGHVAVGALDWRERGAAEPLAGLDQLDVSVGRVDPRANVFLIDRVALSGGQIQTARTVDGFDAGGVAFGSAGPSAAPAPTTGRSVVAAEAQQPAAIVKAKIPTVQIKELDLGASRVVFRDGKRPSAAPVVIEALHLTSPAPLELRGEAAVVQPPSELDLTCAVEPLARHVNATITASPFAGEPTVAIDFAGSGVNGEGLTQVIPELQPLIDGAPLRQGNFAGHFEMHAKLDRRSPVDFDVSHGVDLDVAVKQLRFAAEANGQTLAGVEEVRADAVHIQPDAGLVRAKLVEIDNVTGRVLRDADGVHVCGCVLKVPSALAPRHSTPAAALVPAGVSGPMFAVSAGQSPAGRSEQETVTGPQAVASGAGTGGAESAGVPSHEIRIDTLQVSGIDFDFEDRAVTPPVVVPITGLDLEAHDLTTLALYEDVPMRFSALVNSGKVPLPVFKGSGAAAATTAPLATQATGPATEEREVFSQITADGRVGFYPTPHGRVRASISAFDLAAIEGYGNAFGVSLSHGVFDNASEVQINSGQSLDVRATSSVTDLSLTEPPGGPIEHALGLNAPLDVAIGALQDPDGSITVPMSLPVRGDHVSGRDVAGAAMGALTGVIVTAVASAPIKAVDMLGIGGKKQVAVETPITIGFSPGDTTLDATAIEQLDDLAARMQKDSTLSVTVSHQLGGGDLARARVLANPSQGDALALAGRLHGHKLELLETRGAVAARARALMAGGDGDGAEAAMDQLRAIDRELAATEDNLDALYDLLRPGADRQQQRRTRAACLQIARQRLDLVEAQLRAALGDAGQGRVQNIAPRYEEVPGDAGGEVTITITHVKLKQS